MPKDYLRCRDAMTNEGKPMKEAQRICSIAYYRRHGHAMPHDAKSGLSADLIPVDASEHPMDSADEAIVLDWLYNTLKSEGRLDLYSEAKDFFRDSVKVK